MPNWCENKLEVRGSKADLDKFMAAAAGPDKGGDNVAFSFHRFRPMPEEYTGIIHGSTTIDGKSVSEWREVEGKSVALTSMERQVLMSKYGATNWYDWANQNWGTKWDAIDVGGPVVEEESLGVLGSEVRAVYSFSTAWRPPVALLHYISTQYPTLRFNDSWTEEGGAAGDFTYINGEEV